MKEITANGGNRRRNSEYSRPNKKLATTAKVEKVVKIDGQPYKIINKGNSQTQAIAVAPCDKDVNADYFMLFYKGTTLGSFIK